MQYGPREEEAAGGPSPVTGLACENEGVQEIAKGRKQGVELVYASIANIIIGFNSRCICQWMAKQISMSR